MKKIILLVTLCLPLLFGSCAKKIEDITITIYGTVVDADTQTPISGVLVWVSVGAGTKSKVTGIDGYFEFSDLEANQQYTVVAQKEGYSSADRKIVKANAGKRVEIILTLEK